MQLHNRIEVCIVLRIKHDKLSCGVIDSIWVANIFR